MLLTLLLTIGICDQCILSTHSMIGFRCWKRRSTWKCKENSRIKGMGPLSSLVAAKHEAPYLKVISMIA
jgi:hypothetical protein